MSSYTYPISAMPSDKAAVERMRKAIQAWDEAHSGEEINDELMLAHHDMITSARINDLNAAITDSAKKPEWTYRMLGFFLSVIGMIFLIQVFFYGIKIALISFVFTAAFLVAIFILFLLWFAGD